MPASPRLSVQSSALPEVQPLILATRNPGKVRELADALRRFGFDVRPLPEDFPEIEETGRTFEENALLKAHAVADTLGLPALADDSGLEVDALNGAPGVYSARYGLDTPLLPGEDDDARNNRKLLAVLAHAPRPRTGRFRCCMALARPGKPDLVVHGVWEGHIADAPSGNNGFGYDPLFVDPERGRISAELTREEKNSRSHRGKALRLLLQTLEGEQAAGGAGTPA